MAKKLTPDESLASDARTIANLRRSHPVEGREDQPNVRDFGKARQAQAGQLEATAEHVEQARQWREHAANSITPPNEDRLKSLRERMAAKNSAPNKNLPKESWSDLSTFNKVNGALCLVGAAMSGIGAFSGFRNAVQHDENGKTQIAWTPLGFAILNTAFTVGLGYLAHQSFTGKAGGMVM